MIIQGGGKESQDLVFVSASVPIQLVHRVVFVSVALQVALRLADFGIVTVASLSLHVV